MKVYTIRNIKNQLNVANDYQNPSGFVQHFVTMHGSQKFQSTKSLPVNF